MIGRRAWWLSGLGVLVALAGCTGDGTNCTTSFRCPNSQTFKYCDGAPPSYQTSDGKKFDCATNTDCTAAHTATILWCNTVAPDAATGTPRDAGTGDASDDAGPPMDAAAPGG